MPEEKGIKELREAIEGSLELGLVMAELLQDGISISDGFELADKFKNDPDLSAKLYSAWEDVSLVPGEIKDISFSESMELIMVLSRYITKYIKAFTK